MAFFDFNSKAVTRSMTDIRPIAGYPNYGVDQDGNTYKLNDGVWMPKRQTIGNVGYPVIALWANNKGKTCTVHRLVLEAFVGPCPVGMEALHTDGNRLNNKVSNLRWGTRKENVADMVAHGRATIGSKNVTAKLSFVDVLWVRDMHEMGFTPKELTKHFPVSVTTIRRVINRVTYQKEQVNGL